MNSPNAYDSFELDDCGKEMKILDRNFRFIFETEIQMVIKAPKGTLVIFNTPYTEKKCEAIRAFVEVHKYD